MPSDFQNIPTRMTGREALVRMLRAEGVQFIFGNPGTSETPLLEALETTSGIHYVLALQEGVAMGMADAFARATGSPAFVNLHIETGLANGISLLQNAREGGTPLVLSAGNKDSRELIHGRTDLVEMVRQFTKWSAEITRPSQIPFAVRRAFNEARTPPQGPTFLSFSADGMDEAEKIIITPSQHTTARFYPDPVAIENAVHYLVQAQNPIIIVGDRVACTGASKQAIRLAELWGARVYSPFYSEMVFPTNHPQYLGPIRFGNPGTREFLSKADVIVVLGRIASGYYMFSRPELDYFGHETKLIHIDVDPREIGRTQPTEVGIVSDLHSALDLLCQSLEERLTRTGKTETKKRALEISSEKKIILQQLRQNISPRWDNRPMVAERMMTEVASALPENVVIANDSITSTAALHQAMDFSTPGSIYAGRGGAIGWGMGGALGLKLAYPDRPVVAFVGDGTAMMTVQALWTAANEKLPVVYIVCNNSSYRILKLNMNTYKSSVLGNKLPQSRYIGMDFAAPLDLAAMAQAQGVFGRRIEDPAELALAVTEAIELDRPALLDVILDSSL